MTIGMLRSKAGLFQTGYFVNFLCPFIYAFKQSWSEDIDGARRWLETAQYSVIGVSRRNIGTVIRALLLRRPLRHSLKIVTTAAARAKAKGKGRTEDVSGQLDSHWVAGSEWEGFTNLISRLAIPHQYYAPCWVCLFNCTLKCRPKTTRKQIQPVYSPFSKPKSVVVSSYHRQNAEPGFPAETQF